MSNYQRDGVAVLRGVLDEVPLDILRWAIGMAQDQPSPMSRNLAVNGSTFFNDFDTWRKNPYIEWLAKTLAPPVAAATGNQSLRLHHDHVIVKTGDSPETPWHQDRPYYLVDGPSNFTIWVSPGEVLEEEGLQFIPGSHLIGRMFVPVNFTDGTPMGDGMEVLTEDTVQTLIDQLGARTYDLEAGDTVIFDNRIIHRAVRSNAPVPRSSLSIRYLGDGATMTWNGVNQTPPFHRMGLRFDEGDEPNDQWFPRIFP